MSLVCVTGKLHPLHRIFINSNSSKRSRVNLQHNTCVQVRFCSSKSFLNNEHTGCLGIVYVDTICHNIHTEFAIFVSRNLFKGDRKQTTVPCCEERRWQKDVDKTWRQNRI